MKFIIVFGLISFSFFVNAESQKAFNINHKDKNISWGACPPIFPETCKLAVLHGDPAKPNADLLLKATEGTKFIAHVHNSAERMILVDGEMEVQYMGNKKQILKKGDYAFGPALMPHEAKCIKGTCYLFIAFEAPVNAEPYNGEIK